MEKKHEGCAEETAERMKVLVRRLNEASRAYYAEDREIMSNYEYDRLYDELTELENRTGVVLSDSPTVRVGYEAVEELPKETHESPMLSLDKTKDREALREFIGEHETLLSWKMDGLTVVLTYRNGSLEKAVTRGNGTVGEVVTNNARVFAGLPLKIPYQGELILRGEAFITYSDFEKINEEIEDVDARYKNPRNLCRDVYKRQLIFFLGTRSCPADDSSGLSHLSVKQDDCPVQVNNRQGRYARLRAREF